MVFAQKHVLLAVLMALAGLPRVASPATGTNAAVKVTPSVIIDYFYEAGCADCYKVKNQVVPELKERFEGYYIVNSHDVGIKTNVIRLVAYQEHLNIVTNKPVMMVVDYRHVFNGFDAIRAGLITRVDECIAERQEPGWKLPEVIEDKGDAIVANRAERFTLPVIVTAGFLDGLNPCAIATLVFFMSFLAVAKVKGRGLLLMGVSFCLASFVTYTALGFGLLRMLHVFSGFHLVRHIVDYSMIVLLAVLALLSFKDAWRYAKTGNPGDVTLQLPESIKQRIHAIIRTKMEYRRQDSEVGKENAAGREDCGQNLQNKHDEGIALGRLATGGVIIGVLVTALESVCTGQMYVPTLVVMAGEGMSKAWCKLLVYNVMFILPLVVVFILTFLGLRSQALLEWSRKNVAVSKVLMGLFFLVLAGLILAL